MDGLRQGEGVPTAIRKFGKIFQANLETDKVEDNSNCVEGASQLHVYHGKGLSSEIKIACTGGHQNSQGIASKAEARGFVIGHCQPGTPPLGQGDQSQGLRQPGTSQAGWVGSRTAAWAHSGLATQVNQLRRN